MRCQHCGKRLPILRKLTDSEFCSPEHRRAFQEEQERHALSRLLEASQLGRRQQPKPAELDAKATAKPPAKAVPGRDARKDAASTPPAVERFFPLRPEGTRPMAEGREIPALMKVSPELLLPDGLSRRNGRRIALRLRTAPSQFIPLDGRGQPAAARPAAAQDHLPAAPGGLFPQRRVALAVRLGGGWLKPLSLAARRGEWAMAKPVKPEPKRPQRAQLLVRRAALRTDWQPPRRLESNRMAEKTPPAELPRPMAGTAPGTLAFPAQPYATPPPAPLQSAAPGGKTGRGPREPALGRAIRMAPLSLAAQNGAEGAPVWTSCPLPGTAALRLQSPGMARAAKPSQIRGTWLMPLAGPTILPAATEILTPATTALPPPPAGLAHPFRKPIRLHGPEAARALVPLPSRYAAEPRRMADPGRTLFLTVMARTQRVEQSPAMPGRKVAVAARALGAVETGLVPVPSPFAPLAGVLIDAAQAPARVYRPQPLLELHSRRMSPAGGAPKKTTRLVRWVPNLSGGFAPTDLMTPEAAWGKQHLKPAPPKLVLRPEPARTQKQSLMSDALRQLPVQFRSGRPWGSLWSKAPADLRWVALVVPVVVGLAWFSFGRRSGAAVEVAAPEASPSVVAAAPAAPAEPGFLDSLREKISQRAAVEVSDDFRSGLSAWEGNPGWSDGWSYDQAGFVRPGPLALLRPTLHLKDYTFEFLGKIDHRALSWVYRAKDTRNYYAGKLVMVQAGPLPKVHLVRYRVVNGREEGRRSTPVPEQLRLETLYRVKIDVSGNDFTTSVLGKVVDTYSDGLHTQGGIGFFAARGEESKIRWVELSHQYDTIGRLCAFLAPPQVPSQAGLAQTAGRKP